MSLLLDTGPLVAAIDRSDKHHDRCAALLESAEGPLLVPSTVLVEVCWLLAASLAALSAARAWVKSRRPARARARIACSRAAPVPACRRVRPSSA